MKCKNNSQRELSCCGSWNGEEWICNIEYEPIRPCHTIVVDADAWKKFIEETKTSEYKEKQNEISKRIEDHKNKEAEDNATDLKNWIGNSGNTIDQADDVLEFLHDRRLLNEIGEKVRTIFWKRHIKK